ncbi:hypothetical protein IQ265_23275 [Nodosilinea sp. LEGE 06152]|uniref:hypothetical protein n=1 Tax=Nodosilinea sp. LEGE 06152 TaxID=2777966 RepID=UPI00187FDCD4|nr:hypothetical protein [Nodosilinea sp. LEGE 06152]MBE9159734.1 hypothetical protein [Nodosilinea sp. LEGE 06152]
MNQPPAPPPGANFQCPCNLSSIRPSLLALSKKARANGGQLTPIQAELYSELCEAWQYYRPTQPPKFKGEVDGLVDAIGAFRVGVA